MLNLIECFKIIAVGIIFSVFHTGKLKLFFLFGFYIVFVCMRKLLIERMHFPLDPFCLIYHILGSCLGVFNCVLMIGIKLAHYIAMILLHFHFLDAVQLLHVQRKAVRFVNKCVHILYQPKSFLICHGYEFHRYLRRTFLFLLLIRTKTIFLPLHTCIFRRPCIFFCCSKPPVTLLPEADS